MAHTTTVWLARHGEVHNPQELLYGRMRRMTLSPEGRRQADALASFLTSRPLQAIYSSPLLRARKTAERILLGQPRLNKIRIDSDLLEIRSGWEGEPLASLERIDWDFYAHPRGDDDETMQAILHRMQRWLERMLKRHPGGEVVGVSHGDPILILVGTLRGMPLDAGIFPRPYIDPASVYRMRFTSNSAGSVKDLRDLELFVPHAEAAA